MRVSGTAIKFDHHSIIFAKQGLRLGQELFPETRKCRRDLRRVWHDTKAI
jgi:hypothetical protein